MIQSLRSTILLIASLAILASAALHGSVNVPHLREDLLEIGVRYSLVRTVVLILYFSVVAMFAFGGLVLSAAAASLRGRSIQTSSLYIVAATYVVFGVAAFAFVTHSIHML